MTDFISRAVAIKAFTGKPPEYYHTSYIVSELNDIPAVDAVPVVRCKDCKYAPINLGAVCSPENIKWGDSRCFEGEDSEGCPYNCGDPWYSVMPEPHWYCWKGNRKEQ